MDAIAVYAFVLHRMTWNRGDISKTLNCHDYTQKMRLHVKSSVAIAA